MTMNFFIVPLSAEKALLKVAGNFYRPTWV